MRKQDRQALILDLISKFDIDTQEQLTAKINESGDNVSQATISRDIVDLNLVKVKYNNKFKYTKPTIQADQVPQKIIELLKQVTVSYIVAKNLLVIKTLSGNAGTAGMAIDQMNITEIVGTIAGDDTLLIITKDDKDAQIVYSYLSKL